ncbi:MAG TPA: SDR family oxidoreductase [Roseiflexaceae bacterium]|nr:SDR family oxidoreductase [Roseiflexaceae bacterium]
MDRYLVTGGAGFIGSHIVEALVREGKRVRVFDNFFSGRRENLVHVLDDIELMEGDLRDLEAVRRACAGAAVVFHQGAIPSVQRSIEDPLTSNAANVDGTLNVLIAARDAGARRVVLASSSSVYGDSPTLPKVESMPPDPRSPYAVSKLAAECYALAWTASYGLPAIALRYFNVFGPRQDPRSDYAAVIPRFVTRMLRGEPPVIYGDGLQSRDFTYVADVVAANLLAAEAPPAVSGAFNVACGGRHTLLDLVAALNSLLGTQLAPVHAPPRPGEVRHSQADITRARQALGFAPRYTLLEGLERTVAHFREQQV